MKNKKIKLSLKKESITDLSGQQMGKIVGGQEEGSFAFCGSSAHHFTCGCTNNTCSEPTSSTCPTTEAVQTWSCYSCPQLTCGTAQ